MPGIISEWEVTKEMLREPKMEKLLEPRLLWEQGITVGRGKERRGSEGEEGGRKQGRKETKKYRKYY